MVAGRLADRIHRALLGDAWRVRLLVANANGSGEHVIATTGNIALSNQPWSPDGTRIAWGPAYAGDVYTASADGGDVRRISLRRAAQGGSLVVSDRLASRRTPQRSSRGSEQDWELFVASDDGTPPVQITSGGSGAVINATTELVADRTLDCISEAAGPGYCRRSTSSIRTEPSSTASSTSRGTRRASRSGRRMAPRSPTRTLSMAATRGSGLPARRYSSSMPTDQPYSG